MLFLFISFFNTNLCLDSDRRRRGRQRQLRVETELCVGSRWSLLPKSQSHFDGGDRICSVSLSDRDEREWGDSPTPQCRWAANNLPKVNIHNTMATMDPLMTPLGQMLLEEITPVVMLISTASVEEASRKNGLSFLQMLTPFCSFDNIDGNLVLRIQSFLIHYPLCVLTPHQHCSSSCSAC